MTGINSFYLKPLRCLLLTLPFVLTACGGGSGSDDSDDVNTNNESVTVTARDITTAIYQGEDSVISLKSAITASDGSPVMLKSLHSLSSSTGCNDYTLGSQTFTLTGYEPGLCLYEYTVTDSTGTQEVTAYAQVAIFSPGAPLVSSNNLTPLSEVAELGETITITLDPPASNDTSSAMVLSSDVILIGGIGTSVDPTDTSLDAVATVDPTSNTITFTAGTGEEDVGVSRIYYTYSDDSGYVRVGTIDITVSSDTLNNAPVAGDWTYVTYSDLMGGHAYTELNEGEAEKIIVNLRDLYADQTDSSGNAAPTLSLVSDTDSEDTLRIVSLQSFNGNAVLLDNDDMTFSFYATEAGKYYVSYTVEDQKGGYATGIMEFRVEGAWDNVIVEDTSGNKFVLAAPLTLEAATLADYDVGGTAAEESTDESGNVIGNGYEKVPTYTWSAAYAICLARGGSLPTETQMEAFQTQEGNPFIAGDGNGNEELTGWPIARAYFTSTESSTEGYVKAYFAQSAADGGDVIADVNGGELPGSTPYYGYLACIDQTPKTLEITNSFLLQDVEEQQLKAQFTTAANNTFEYTKPLYWTVGSVQDSSLSSEEMPNIGDGSSGNVLLDYYTGEFNALDKGYINITATTPLQDLTTSKDLEVYNNLLSLGGADVGWTDNTGYPNPDNEACIADNMSKTQSFYNYKFTNGFVFNGVAMGSQSKMYLVHYCSDDLETNNNQLLIKQYFYKDSAINDVSMISVGAYPYGTENAGGDDETSQPTDQSEPYPYSFHVPEDGYYTMSIDVNFNKWDEFGSAGNPLTDEGAFKFTFRIADKSCSINNTGESISTSLCDDAIIEDLGDGWYRYSVTTKFEVYSSSTSDFIFFMAGDNTNGNGNGSSLWDDTYGTIYLKNPMLLPATD